MFKNYNVKKKMSSIMIDGSHCIMLHQLMSGYTGRKL